MSRTDKSFWITIIPAVILWNTVRAPLVSGIFESGKFQFELDGAPAAIVITNIIFSCILSAIAGFIAAYIAAPKHIHAGTNLAVGVIIAFGLQNIIEYYAKGYPKWYFVILPLAAGLMAVAGSCLFKLGRRRL